MFKLIMLAVLGGGGFYFYKTHIYKSEPYKAYEKFTAAYDKGDCATMEAMVDGSAKSYVESLCASHSMTVFGRTVQTPSAMSMAQDMRSTPAGMSLRSVRTLESEASAGDETTLTVLDKVAGRRSQFMQPRDPLRQTVKLQKSGEGWKITEWAEESIKP